MVKAFLGSLLFRVESDRLKSHVDKPKQESGECKKHYFAKRWD